MNGATCSRCAWSQGWGPDSAHSSDSTLLQSFNPTYLQRGNGRPWLRWHNAVSTDGTHATQEWERLLLLPMPTPDKRGEEGTFSPRSVWLGLPQFPQSMNGQRLLMKPSLARSPFSPNWGPPSFVWIWEDGLGNRSVWWHRARLSVLGAAPT